MATKAVGLFLDLDGVLTPKPVNLQFATMLDIEHKLLELEDQYALGLVDNNKFNEVFVPMFREARFTKQFASERFREIQLNPCAEQLVISALPNVFIVSSSPSYYVEQFATKFGIPSANVKCSRYEFDGDGNLLRCVEPCGIQDKSDFVSRRAGQFRVSIAVGDTLEQDARFMQHCSIRILMGGTHRNFLHASDLNGVINLYEAIRRPELEPSDDIPPECATGVAKLHEQSPHERNVFIMTPFREDARYRAILEAARGALGAKQMKGWTAADRILHEDLWTNVRCFMHGCSAGIAVITDERPVARKNLQKGDVYNPNVATELGCMMAHGKRVLLLKDRAMKVLPTDLLGKLYVDFNLSDPDREVREAVERWMKDV